MFFVSVWLARDDLGLFFVKRRGGKEGPEFSFVQALVVSLFRGNAFHFEMFHDRVVQRLVPQFFADLNHAGKLMCFAFPDQVRNGSRENQNLQRGDAPFFVDAFEQVLCNHPA